MGPIRVVDRIVNKIERSIVQGTIDIFLIPDLIVTLYVYVPFFHKSYFSCDL